VPFSTVNRALLYLTPSGAGNPIGRPPTYDLRMTILSRLPAALLIILALACSFALRGSHAAVSTTLEAFVNDQGNIGINYADGSSVGKAIPPGTYTLHVDDSTSFHNFHLYGPGFDDSTDVGLLQKSTWTVTFQTGGVYTYICDLHPDSMMGQVTATNDASSVTGGQGGNGSSGAPPTSGGVQSNAGKPSSAATADPLRGSLSGAVSAAGKLTLRLNGKPVTTLEFGRYHLTVADASKHAGFAVASHGSTVQVTAPSFVGKRTTTVDLSKGQWSFFAVGGAKHPSYFTASA
jgi:hypothetical protein